MMFNGAADSRTSHEEGAEGTLAASDHSSATAAHWPLPLDLFAPIVCPVTLMTWHSVLYLLPTCGCGSLTLTPPSCALPACITLTLPLCTCSKRTPREGVRGHAAVFGHCVSTAQGRARRSSCGYVPRRLRLLCWGRHHAKVLRCGGAVRVHGLERGRGLRLKPIVGQPRPSCLHACNTERVLRV